MAAKNIQNLFSYREIVWDKWWKWCGTSGGNGVGQVVEMVVEI